jgi:ribose-phosphate pyrophosphokinase
VLPGIEVDNLSSTPAMAEALRTSGFNPATVVVGPDAESRPWVSRLAGELQLPFAVAQKTRRSDRSVEITLPDPRIVAGRPTLLVDDIVSSGGTLVACARSLLTAGATAVNAIVTHALFAQDATAEFVNAGIRSVRSTTSVPHPTNAIQLDGLLAEALQAELEATRIAEQLP